MPERPAEAGVESVESLADREIVDVLKRAILAALEHKDDRTITSLCFATRSGVRGLSIPLQELVAEGSVIQHPGFKKRAPRYSLPGSMTCSIASRLRDEE